VDATKCISYLTIELKDVIAESDQDGIHNWLYGCDICQDVCPWNGKAKLASFSDLHPRDYVVDNDLKFWQNLTQEQYDSIFEGSAIRRAKFDKFSSNISIVTRNIS
jgi:epoxyqueuosine reductase